MLWFALLRAWCLLLLSEAGFIVLVPTIFYFVCLDVMCTCFFVVFLLRSCARCFVFACGVLCVVLARVQPAMRSTHPHHPVGSTQNWMFGVTADGSEKSLGPFLVDRECSFHVVCAEWIVLGNLEEVLRGRSISGRPIQELVTFDGRGRLRERSLLCDTVQSSSSRQRCRV